MSDILRIASTAVMTALCCLVLRKLTPELALVAAIVGGALIFWLSASSFEYVKDFLKELSERAGIAGSVLAPVVKVIGIALVSKTAGEFCKDVKEGGVAAFLDLAATLTALVTTIPLIRAVLNTVSELI